MEATIERIKEHKVVLAPQDTTTLNYEHPATEGFGPIGTKTDTAMGLLLHDTVAFTDEGTPLGILDAQCWARDPDDKGKSERRKETPIEEKESIWRGLQRLDTVVEMYAIFKKLPLPRIRQFYPYSLQPPSAAP